MKYTVKLNLALLLLLFVATSAVAQNVFSGEPVQIVGPFNNYSPSPYASDYRTMSYRRISTTNGFPTDGRGQWATTINVNASGGDINPITMSGGSNNGFLFISGPANNRFQNKWAFANIGSGVIGSNINNISAFNSGEDMGLNMSFPGFYTFIFNDVGYTTSNSKYWVAYTQNQPVTVSRSAQSFSLGKALVSINTNVAPSQNENIYVRYRNVNDFSTTGSNVVQAVGSGTNWVATIPQQNCGDTIYYYVFTSTRTLTNILVFSDPTYRSMSAINFDDNSGSNYSYTLEPSTSAVISGSNAICQGETTNLTVDITGGTSPYVLVLNDGTNNFTINNYISGTSIPVSPNSNTDYSIVSVTSSNSCIGSGYSGLAEVTIKDDVIFYQDIDGDGFGNDSVTTLTCLQPNGFVTVGGDCDDTNNTVYPGAAEICYDGLDNNCDGIIDNGCTPIVSVVQPAQCGVILPKIDSYVYANLVAGAQGYRFRITNLSTNEVQTIDRALRVFRFTQLTNYAFATEYAVEVSVRINNVWQPFYGTPCNVSTPGTTTQIQASQCNSTLTNINNPIFADNVPFATGYRFRVTNTLNPIDVQTIDRPLREFRMSNLASVEFNTTYNIEVAIRNTDGSHLSYGPVCDITTPMFPIVGLINDQCDAYLVGSNTESLFAETYPDAEQYRFLLENAGLGFSQSVDKALRTVTLNNFTGLQPGETYTVLVAIRLNGVWGSYGKSCSIITPGGVAKTDKVTRTNQDTLNAFKAIAYPNPFTASFAIDMRTSTIETVNVTVYDMTGRLLEVTEVKAQDITNYQFGDRYPSGVYNVVVTQGNETRTLRVVKQ